MQSRQVQSTDYPQSEQLLQGKRLVNIDITESTITVDNVEATTYTYTQLVVDTSQTAEDAILEYNAEVAQDYLDSTDYLMTVDKYASLDADRQAELTEKREEARQTVRAYKD